MSIERPIMWTCRAIAWVAVALTGAAASAQSYHLDFRPSGTFTGTTGIDSPAEAIGAVANATFTPVTGDGTFAGLTLNFGKGTATGGQVIDYAQPVQFINSNTVSGEPLLNNYPIMSNQIMRSGSGEVAVGLAISGLPAGVYDFYLTAFRGSAVAGGADNFRYYVKGTTSATTVTNFGALPAKTIANTNPNSATHFVRNVNYVVLRLTISPSTPNAYLFVLGDRAAVPPPGPYVGVMNSLEIVPVTAPKVGVYPGISDGGIAKGRLDQYEPWLGRPVNYIVQFLGDDMNIAAADIGNLTWWVSQWAPYDQSYRDRMVISIAMLPRTATDSTATLAKGAAGDYNAYWQAVANKLVASGYSKAVIRIGWEMNGHWYRWTAQGGKHTDFKNYWIQIYNTMKAVPGNNFRFLWNPNIANVGMNAMDAFPDVQYVDMIGLDFYDISLQYKNNPNYPNNMTPAELNTFRNNVWTASHLTGTYNLDWWKAQAASLDLPLCFPEWGLDKPLAADSIDQGGEDNPVFVQKQYDWINNPANGVMWASYYDTGTGTQLRNHALFFSTTQYPVSRALYPQLFGPKFSDDFADGNSNGWAAGFPAQWAVVSDASNNVYRWDFNWTNTGDISTAGDTTWRNYTLSAKVKVMTEILDWSETRLIARYTNSNNYYLLELADQTNVGFPITRKFVLNKVVGGLKTPLVSSSTQTINPNTWYNVDFIVDGSTLTAKFNGVQVLQATDTSLTAGKIGLGGRKQDVMFDNVLVKR